jgi:hypothetical protein
MLPRKPMESTSLPATENVSLNDFMRRGMKWDDPFDLRDTVAKLNGRDHPSAFQNA